MKTLALVLTLALTGVSGCAVTNYQTRRAQEEAQANAAAYNAMTPQQRFEHDVPDPEERRLIMDVYRSDQEIAEAHKDDAAFKCVSPATPECYARQDVHRTYLSTLESRRDRQVDQLQAYRLDRIAARSNGESRLAGAMQGFNARRNAEREAGREEPAKRSMRCQKNYIGGVDCKDL